MARYEMPPVGTCVVTEHAEEPARTGWVIGHGVMTNNGATWPVILVTRRDVGVAEVWGTDFVAVAP